MAAPSSTYNTEGNGLASGALAASATTTFNVDASTKFEAQIAIKLTTGGTVQSSKGVQVDIFPLAISTATYATIAEQSYVIPNTAISSTYYGVFKVGTGKYQVKLTNLDTANSVTVSGTVHTVDSIA